MFERTELAEGGVIDYCPNFLSEEDSLKYFNLLLDEVSWEKQEYINYRTGAKMWVPRLNAWFTGDPAMAYTYSGKTHVVQPFTQPILTLKDKVEAATGVSYNSVLLNLYRDGKDSVGFHADDEKELGTNANIASLSLGATRTFVLEQYKKKANPSAKLDHKKYDLPNGSLLVMSGTTQHYWKHSIPKTKSLDWDKIKPRINLTFRTYIKL